MTKWCFVLPQALPYSGTGVPHRSPH
jgi:hypothetical protein